VFIFVVCFFVLTYFVLTYFVWTIFGSNGIKRQFDFDIVCKMILSCWICCFFGLFIKFNI